MAHDFNNILTGINGLSSLALEELESTSPLCDDLKQIRELGERAAGLTRQLLAFSRQQPLETKVVSVNDLVENLLKMLTRLIGEHIRIQFIPNSHSDTVEADLGQIEQVLMNLAVNARDAMPEGGFLTIQIDRVLLQKDTFSSTGTIQPGPYVMLTVTDTGCGMDEKTCRRIFDPFFTTKGVGHGTGLGLSTVYGIVSQHHGYIVVDSTPGQGAAFKIYFPFAVEKHKESIEDESKLELEGSETILVVEDEKSVNDIVDRILKRQDYKVISSSSPKEARGLFSSQHGRKVDLLLTDIVMPGGSGPELYQEFVAKDPTLRVLFMSGYIENDTVREQVLKPGFPFLQKPFQTDNLARKLREVLNNKAPQKEEFGKDRQLPTFDAEKAKNSQKEVV